MSFVRRFDQNHFNFVRADLHVIDANKYRGVVATQHIPKNTIVCLFPGVETYRFPETHNLPREDWVTRVRDQKWLDKIEASLALSDYAIRVSVLDFDDDGREVGYHWRVLDPMATTSDYAQLRDRMKNAHMYAPDMVALPDSWLEYSARIASVLYAQLASRSRIERVSHAATMRERAFYIDDGFVYVFLGGRLQYVCAANELQRLDRRDDIVYNLRLALNGTYDVVEHERARVRTFIRRLQLPDDYEFMGAFINQPYDDEVPNARFVDPHEWISGVHTGRYGCPARLRYAVERDIEYKDLVQRQAIVTTVPIRPGEEILLRYGRTEN